MPETDQKITEIIDNEEKLAAKMTAMKEAQKLYALYTQEQVEAMFSIMEKRLLEVKGRFAPKKEKEDTFSFGRKAE